MDSIILNDNKMFFYSLENKKGILIDSNRIDIFKEYSGNLKFDFVFDYNETILVYIHEGVLINIYETVNSNDLKIDFYIEENANVNYYSLEKGECINKNINLSNNANLNYFQYLVSLNKLNNVHNFNLNEENANLNVNFLDIAYENEIHDNKLKINHLAKNTTADLIFYAASKDKSNINVEAINHILKDMKNSKSTQKTRGIVLNDTGKIKSLPILYIDEFDSIAKHGTTIGKISDEGLFYLMSRGISKEEALKLIVQGFVDPLIKEISDDEFKKRVLLFINNKL